jgi:hypothetical protein
MTRYRILIWIFAASIIFNMLVAWGCLLWSPYTRFISPQEKADHSMPDNIRGPDGSFGWWFLSFGFGVFAAEPQSAEVSEGGAYFKYWRSGNTPAYYRGGWPMFSMQSLVRYQQAPDGHDISGRELPLSEILSRGLQTSWLPSWLHAREDRRLPIVPLWLGFSFDTLFYFGVFSAVVLVWQRVRSRTPNKSPEPTPINRERAAVGAGSLPRKLSGFPMVIAVHVASRRWLSFFR